MATGLEDRLARASLTAAWSGSGAEPANTTLTVNMPGAGAVMFQLTGTFTATVTFEVSVDSAAFESIPASRISTGAKSSTATTTGIFVVHAPGARYVRARVSAYTSGTLAVTANASVAPLSAGSLGTSTPGQVEGTQPAGSALTANPVPIGFVGTGGTLRNATGANQLTATTGNDVLGVGPLVYSTTGPTWDRLRDANSPDNTGGTGLLGAGLLVWDGSAWRRASSTTGGVQRVLSGGYTAIITSTLTRAANTTIYTIADEMSDNGGAIITLTNAARASGSSGVIQGLAIDFSDNWTTKPQLEVWVFDTTSTPVADNGAFAPTDAVVATCIGVIPLTASYVGEPTTGAGSSTTGNMVMDTGPISFPFLTVGSANLFLRFVVRNAAQAGANSSVLTIRARIAQD